MGSSASLAPLSLAALIAFLPRVAHAEATPSEKETARTMMDEGHARRDAGDHAAALAQFQGADAIMHVPTTGLEVGREQVALGQLVEARDTLERIVRTPPVAGEPDTFRVARKTADALDRELSARIPALRITESGGSADVTVDGAPIPAAALIAPIKVNPGHHVVVSAGADGVRQEVDVVEGQTVAVALALTNAPLRAAAAAPSPDAEPAPGASSSSAAVGWLRWGGVGLAGIGAAVGAVTGVMTLSSTSSATKGCVNDRCPPATWGDIDSARTTATVSTVAFVVAGVGAALTIASFVVPSHSAQTTGRRTKPLPAASPRIDASVGPGTFALSGTF